MTISDLIAENDKLKAAIQKHHDQVEDDRCIGDDDELYAAAGLGPADHRVGDKFKMVKRCIRFIDSRCEDGQGNWQNREDLEAEIQRLRKLVAITGVEGSPPPGMEPVIPALMTAARTAWDLLRAAADALVTYNEHLPCREAQGLTIKIADYLKLPAPMALQLLAIGVTVPKYVGDAEESARAEKAAKPI